MFDTVGNAVENFHNDGADLFGFAKAQYVPSNRDVVNLDVSRSRTRFAVPFDSVEGIIDDHQQDVNGFVNLGWHHRFGEGAAVETGSSELFAGAFFRDGSLTYTPGPTDQPSFIFYPQSFSSPPDTIFYNLSEDRNFHTIGVKLDYLLRLHHGLEFKLGTLSSITRGHEDFETTDSAGNPGPGRSPLPSSRDMLSSWVASLSRRTFA